MVGAWGVGGPGWTVVSSHSRGDDPGVVVGRRRSGVVSRFLVEVGVEGLCPRAVSLTMT